jgi:large subunit ribosomal protein L2
VGIKTFKPTAPGLRQKVALDFKEITKETPEKKLTVIKKRTGGRNNLGRVSIRFRGGGHKKHYRLIDFKREKKDIEAKIAAIEYDPNRTAFIALLHFTDGEKRYIPAPLGMKVGERVLTYSAKSLEIDGIAPDIKIGNALPLYRIPVGTRIHNIELKPGKGGQCVRSAGAVAQIVGREENFTVCNIMDKERKNIIKTVNVPFIAIRLPSGEIRRFRGDCIATIGQIGNIDHSNIVLGKAGANIWRGRKSHVRGIVMNPVDHPHGGGEGGKQKGYRTPMSPWGQPAKGYKTRKRKNKSNIYIIKRRNAK